MILFTQLVSEEFINLDVILPFLNRTQQIVVQFWIKNCLVNNQNNVSPVFGQSYANAPIIIWGSLETGPLGSYPTIFTGFS
jgi:hypothetical protein